MVVVHAGVEDRDHRALALRAEVPGARVAGPARPGRPRRAGHHGRELRLGQEAEVVPLLGVVGAVGLVAEQRVVRLAGVEPGGAARRAARGRRRARRARRGARLAASGAAREGARPSGASVALRRRKRARGRARPAGRTACRPAARNSVDGVVGQRARRAPPSARPARARASRPHCAARAAPRASISQMFQSRCPRKTGRASRRFMRPSARRAACEGPPSRPLKATTSLADRAGLATRRRMAAGSRPRLPRPSPRRGETPRRPSSSPP